MKQYLRTESIYHDDGTCLTLDVFTDSIRLITEGGEAFDLNLDRVRKLRLKLQRFEREHKS